MGDKEGRSIKRRGWGKGIRPGHAGPFVPPRKSTVIRGQGGATGNFWSREAPDPIWASGTALEATGTGCWLETGRPEVGGDHVESTVMVEVREE